MAIEFFLGLLFGGAFTGLEAGVADLDTLEVRANNLRGRARALSVDFSLKLFGFLDEPELGVDLDQAHATFAGFRRAEAAASDLLQ